MTPIDVILIRYEKFIVPHEKVCADRKYWVLDTDLACGDSQDNVFESDFVYNGKLLIDSAYLVFKTKSKALACSKDLYIEEQQFFSLQA